MTDGSRSTVTRAAAIAILASLLGAAYFAFIEPIRAAHRNYDREFAAARVIMEKYQHMGAARKVLSQQLAVLKNTLSATSALLKGTDQAIVGANLQAWMKKVTLDNGGQLISLETLYGEAAGDFRTITVRMQLLGSMTALQKIVYRLEKFPPLRVIEHISISRVKSRRRRNKKPDSGMLRARIDVSAFMKAEGN